MLSLVSIDLKAQRNYLVAKLDDPSISSNPSNGLTNNPTLNDILNAHGVYDYGPIFMSVRSDHYHFYLTGNINSLTNELSQYYSEFSIHSFGKPTEPVCNP